MTRVGHIEKTPSGFRLNTNRQIINCQSLIIACGGLSIPKMGATGFAYEIARQFGHNLITTRPGLVPFMMNDEARGGLTDLAGLSTLANVNCQDTEFQDGFLFTHRGLSGPSILQISSFWREGMSIRIDFSPTQSLIPKAQQILKEKPKSNIGAIMDTLMPHRLAQALLATQSLNPQKRLAEIGTKTI